MTSFVGNFIQAVLIGLGILLASIGISFALNYMQAHMIKSGVENYTLDVLAYGTKHNGFNDSYDGSYTFDEMQQSLLKKHKLVDSSRGFDYIVDIELNPTPGTQLKGRSGVIEMTVTYKYPTINPFDSREEMKTSNSKTVSDVVHGYVKEPGLNKTFEGNKPWWLWDDEPTPP